MYTVPLATLLEITEMQPHEVLLGRGQLVEFRRTIGKAVFISHQWVEAGHPDPDCKQFRVLQGAFQKVMAAEWKEIPVDILSEGLNQGKPLPISHFLSEPLFFWYDYFSCPQSVDKSSTRLQDAISSIPAYVDECHFFCALVPTLQNRSGTNLVTPSTWHQRGWCRLERACRELSQNSDWIMVKNTSDLTVISGMQVSTFAGSGPVGDGAFTVEEDRGKLAPVLMTVLKRKLFSLLNANDFAGYRALLNQQPWLLKGLDCESLEPVSGVEDRGGPAMMFFHQNGFRSIRDTDSGGWMPMHYAALKGDPLLVQELLKLQADLNQSTKKGHPALGLEAGLLPLSIACLLKHNEVVQLLISSKSKMTSNALALKPLHCAAFMNNTDAIRMLYEAGSPPEYNALGRSVLQLAAYAGSCEAIEELLRHARATVDVSEPLHSAAIGVGGAEVVQRLVQMRADVNCQSDEHLKRTAFVRALYLLFHLRHRFYKVTPLSKILYHAQGATPLVMALQTGNYECAAALIDAGARLDLRNWRGLTAADFTDHHSLPEFLQEAFEGRVEACQRVTWLASGWI